MSTGNPELTPRETVLKLLGEFEADLRSDATFFQRHDEMMLRSARRPSLLHRGEVNHFEIGMEEDQFTSWAIEMAIKQPKKSGISIPTRVDYVRLLRPAGKDLKHRIWIHEDGFAHPHLHESYYAMHKLRDDIFSIAHVELDDKGRVRVLKSQTSDKIAGVTYSQDLRIDQDDFQPGLPLVPSSALATLENIIQSLPGTLRDRQIIFP